MNSSTIDQCDTQFVTLGIGKEVFAAPVEAMVEIPDMLPIFCIPDAPAYFSGLIDVRGRSVPVIDLRVKLGLPGIAATETTCILVLEISFAGCLPALGLITDRVFEVMSLDTKQVEAPPIIGVKWRSDYISGVGRRNGSFVIIFNFPNLFSHHGPDAGWFKRCGGGGINEPAIDLHQDDRFFLKMLYCADPYREVNRQRPDLSTTISRKLGESLQLREL